MKIDNDRLIMADEAVVCNAAMSVIDRLQEFHPEQQILGLGAAFLLLAGHFKVNPNDLFLTINNIMNGVDGTRPEFKAVQMYIEKELA